MRHERQLLDQIESHTTARQLLTHHCHDSRHCTGPGFPDLTILGPGGLEFWELKAPFAGLRPHQIAWQYSARAAGIRFRLIYPIDLAPGGPALGWLDRLATP